MTHTPTARFPSVRRSPNVQQSTTRFLPGPLKRFREHLRAILEVTGETYALLSAAHEAATAERAALGEHLSREIDSRASQRQVASQHEQLVEILRFVHDRGQCRGERLRRLRADPDYEHAFSTARPLISVVIPTYDNHAMLRERSIPSVLAQTYQNFEVVVVGDAAPDEVRLAVEAFDDPRISFVNLSYRGPYPADPEAAWRVSGVPAYNEAVRRARGLWIAPLDDDDAWRSTHLERLLERARRDRLELAYGRQAVHFADGYARTIGCFPPEVGEFGVQAALYHAGLAQIFEYELADGPLGLPSDWALCRRMMEAGVKIGMLDEVTVDYYPSRSWTQRWEGDRFDAWLKPEAAAHELPEWEYVPEGWERARNPDEPAARGWQVPDVARTYRDKWPQFLAAIQGPGPLGVNHEAPAGVPIDRGSLVHQNGILAHAHAVARAAFASAAARNDGPVPVSVLDWGGALGHDWFLARQLLPEIELDYHCCELPEVCAEGCQLAPYVTFHHGDECFGRQYDLVVASASLSVVQDWRQLLGRLAAAATRWLFISRTPVAPHHPSFVVLQRLHAYGYATEYLGWVLNRRELLGVARAAGFELDREFLLHPPWEVVGAPDEVSRAGFLFRRT